MYKIYIQHEVNKKEDQNRFTIQLKPKDFPMGRLCLINFIFLWFKMHGCVVLFILK